MLRGNWTCRFESYPSESTRIRKPSLAETLEKNPLACIGCRFQGSWGRSCANRRSFEISSLGQPSLFRCLNGRLTHIKTGQHSRSSHKVEPLIQVLHGVSGATARSQFPEPLPILVKAIHRRIVIPGKDIAALLCCRARKDGGITDIDHSRLALFAETIDSMIACASINAIL